MFIVLLIDVAPVSARPRDPAIKVSERRERKVELGASAMFRLANAAVAKGQTATAEAIYSVMEQDSDADVRAEARYRRARLYIAKGRKREAAVLLRRVLDEKPDAAPVRLELANVLAGLGDREAALRELRAVQSTGLPPAVARMVDRYSEALRASRPTGGSFEIALAPDSNINRATRLDSLGTVIGDFEIDEDSKARSGTGLSLRGQAYRRFGLGQSDASLLVRFSGSGDLYRETRFNDLAVDLTAGPEFQLGRTRINLDLGATQRWYGQEPLLRSLQLAATVARPLGSLAQLRISTSAAVLDNRFNDLQDGKRYAGKLAIERALSPAMGLGASVSLSRDALNDPGYSTTGWNVGVLGWRETGRITFSLAAQFGKLHADEALALFPERRSDRFSSLSIGATFRQLQLRGFAPILRLSIERNASTIAFYDYRRTRTEVGNRPGILTATGGSPVTTLAEMAEREGFEPSIRFCRILTFQASAFDHSATAPHAWKGGHLRGCAAVGKVAAGSTRP